jgi:8-oxo-dGTP diphosphatase
MKTMYEKSWVAIDAVLFTILDGKLLCYLRRREKAPFIDKYELLGGLLLQNETADQALIRKLKQTLGGTSIYFQQFYTFTKVDRDPRERAISIAYIALVSPDKIQNISDWYEYDKLPKIAFDHAEIIKAGYLFLQQNLNQLIARQFMPKYFPLNKLQEVYEIIQRKRFDNRNFRKKMIQSEIVKETKQRETEVSHRPAVLYKFTK